MKITVLALLLALSSAFWAQSPEITSWLINSTDEEGYGGIPSNVQSVQFTSSDVYVSATCIPGYDIGPWAGNPNTPSNQDFTFKITRSPQENNGNDVATGLGHIGVWINGVSIFNPKDAFSYNDQGIWNQNAIIVEGASFDDCLGHPAPNGEYHTHLNPTCLYDDTDDEWHSPIIGYAFDGFPIYGAYAYENTDGTGPIVRMESSYQPRNITQRHSLPDGTTLSAGDYGPDVSNQYPIGYFIEDYEFINGLGSLDVHNGRFCITPEYPDGIYAYFVTINANLEGVYPYIIGPTYYGTVQSGNTGPQSGHNIVPSNAETFTPLAVISEDVESIKLETHFYFWRITDKQVSSWSVLDLSGKIISEGSGNEMKKPESYKGFAILQCISEFETYTFRVFCE